MRTLPNSTLIRLATAAPLGVLATLVASATVQAQILVRVVDITSDVRIYEPVFVTYSIENTGSEPELVPVESGVAQDGVSLHTGREGEPLRFEQEFLPARLVGGSARDVWLDPGEKWLFFSEISQELGGVGTFQVQAVLASSGECGGFVVGPTRHDLAPLLLPGSDERANRPLYRCWQGEARSNVWSVTVVESAYPEEALASSFEGSWRELTRVHPRAAYSYGLLVRLGLYKEAMEMQPSNPLNKYLGALRLREVLRKSSPCFPERYRRSAGEYSIHGVKAPRTVKDYLYQVEWYERNRECGERRSSGEGE